MKNLQFYDAEIRRNEKEKKKHTRSVEPRKFRNFPTDRISSSAVYERGAPDRTRLHAHAQREREREGNKVKCGENLARTGNKYARKAAIISDRGLVLSSGASEPGLTTRQPRIVKRACGVGIKAVAAAAAAVVTMQGFLANVAHTHTHEQAIRTVGAARLGIVAAAMNRRRYGGGLVRAERVRGFSLGCRGMENSCESGGSDGWLINWTRMLVVAGVTILVN